METLGPGTSIDRIVEATETNYIGYLRGLASLEQVTWSESPEMTWFLSDLTESWLNRIVRFQVSRGDLEAAVDSALDIFRSKNLAFQWVFGPPAQRGDLAGLLEARGGRSMGEDVGMALDLSTIVAYPPLPTLAIRPVQDPASATDWRDVFSASFGISLGVSDLYREVELNELRSESRRMTFVAYSAKTPVSIGTLCLAGGVAGIMTIATIPEARKQGFGKALTAYLLQQAISLGYEVSVLMASAMGAGVYQSLGFRKTCDFHRYEFPVSGSEQDALTPCPLG